MPTPLNCFARRSRLSLDADEELLPTSLEEMRAAVQRNNAFAYFVQRQDLVNVADPSRFTEVSLVRLWRNHPQVRYVGRVHSQFLFPLGELAARQRQLVLNSSIQLRHFGLAADRQPEKAARDVRLLELELRDRPGDFYYLVELGRTQLSMGNGRGLDALAQAAAQVATGDAAAVESGGALVLLLEIVLAADSLPTDFPLSRAEARRIADQRFPRAVPLLWQSALSEFRRERFAECAELLERIVELGKSKQYDRLASFDPAILSESALLNLGACYVRLARLDEAAQCFRSLANHPRHAAAANENLRVITELRPFRAN